MVSRLALGALAFTTDVVVARHLGPTLKGQYYTFVITASVIGTLAVAGQDYALNEFRKKGESLPRVFAGGLLIAFVVWLGVSSLGLSTGTLAALLDRLGAPPAGESFSIVALAGAEALFLLAGMMVVTAGKPVAYSVLRVIRRGAVLTGVGVVVLMGVSGSEAIGRFLLVQVMAVGGSAMVATWVGGFRLNLPLRRIGPLARSGLRNLPGRLSERLQGRLVVFLVGALSGAAAVGVFSVAIGIAELLFYVTGSLSTVLFSVSGREDHEYLRPLRLAWIVVGTGALLAGGMGWALIPLLYGPAFAEAGVLLLLVVPGVACLGLVQTLSPFLVLRGRAGAISIGQVSGLVALTISVVLLAPKVGVRGAAIGVTMGYATTLAVCVYATVKETGMGLRELLSPTRDDWSDAAARLRRVLRRRNAGAGGS